ncbi:MAG TPA: adenylate/guanylate cyclase domain-containing protein [Solirubrobacterales bacterium]|nr:adenylate/guanylate cyclase domain-containing protein [Solirubrobacterales bacterium]
MGEDAPAERLAVSQRAARRRLRKAARKQKGEPLSSEDWAAYFAMASDPMGRTVSRMLRSLPTSPRCGICGAPFSGFGSRLLRPLGYRPSRKSPNLCAVCVESAPPGGMTTEAGVLFADIRGFTRLSEQRDPEEVSALLRRFYRSAEHVLQGQARGGEIVASARLVERLDEPPPGERIELDLKGKAEPVPAYRI